MPKGWRFLPHDQARIRQLSHEVKVPFLVAQVLLARGFGSPEAAGAFLGPKLTDLHDPETLPGVSKAAERVVSAIRSERRITIYGDYDVDGVTATSLLWHCLKLAGASVDYYIPHRLDEGYGLHLEALQKLHQEDPDRLVVTVDCGITSVKEAAAAKQLGLELIITDHHELDDGLPDAAVLVHPRLPGSDYPFGELCGAGVAFKLAWDVCRRLGDGKKATPRMREFLMGAVALTAIGTVADVVPLLDENRVLVRYGLNVLPDRSTPGLKALMKVAGVDPGLQPQSEDIAFSMGPRLNAAGRLGQARLAVELLTTENGERATVLAKYLDELNKNRQTIERRILRQAKELVSDHTDWAEQPALVLAHHDWHAGVIGIVASRLVERFEKPVILLSLTDDQGKGSGRSFAGFDLHAGLSACSEHLASYGGHQAAVGLEIAADKIDDFRTAFCQYVAQHHEVTDRDKELRIDAEVRLADLTHQAITQLDRLGPFGHKNPRPIFAASQVELAEPPRTMGGGDRHLSLRVRHYGTVMRAVAFGRGEWAKEIEKSGGPIALCFEPMINRFRGRETVELRLLDWQSETDASSASSPSSAVSQDA